MNNLVRHFCGTLLINLLYASLTSVGKKAFNVCDVLQVLSYLLIITKGSLLHSVLLRAI